MTHSPSVAATDPVRNEAEQLVQLLTQQRDLYASLSQLSEQQQGIVAQGKTDELLTVLSERQIIVDRLTQINAEIAPLRGRMSQVTAEAPEATRQTIRSLVADVQTMLQSIIQRDEQDRRQLEESKAQVGRQLSKVRAAPTAIHAYKTNAYASRASASGSAARFTDSRG